MRSKLTGGLLACLVMLPSVAAAAVYNQPARTAGSVGWTQSQLDLGATEAQRQLYMVAYESFTLSSTQSFNQLLWTGAYVEIEDPSQGTMNLVKGFTISIYDSVNGLPPAYDVISSNAWFATQDNPVLSGSGFVSEYINGNANESPFAVTDAGTQLLSYSANINSFTAFANRQYWVSIVAHLDTDIALWGWTEGLNGDEISYGDAEDSALEMVRRDYNYDLAFTAVPEPSSVVVCIGLVGGAVAGGLARRRKARAAVKSAAAA